MFGFFKKKKEEVSSDMTKDEEQIEKAKADVEEKGDDSQTEKDRVDESVGEQERKDGDEDSQTAKDRVDESEGTKKADEERAEDEGEKGNDALSEKIVAMINTTVEAAVSKAVAAAMAKALDDMGRKPEEVSDAEADALTKVEGIYGE